MSARIPLGKINDLVMNLEDVLGETSIVKQLKEKINETHQQINKDLRDVRNNSIQTVNTVLEELQANVRENATRLAEAYPKGQHRSIGEQADYENEKACLAARQDVLNAFKNRLKDVL